MPPKKPSHSEKQWKTGSAALMKIASEIERFIEKRWAGRLVRDLSYRLTLLRSPPSSLVLKDLRDRYVQEYQYLHRRIDENLSFL
jgi:hypothetical protein